MMRQQPKKNGSDKLSILLISAPGFASGWAPLNIARMKSFLTDKGYHVDTMPLCVFFTDYISRRYPSFRKLDEEIGEFGHTWHELYFAANLFGHEKPERLIMQSLIDMNTNKDIYYTGLNFRKNIPMPSRRILTASQKEIASFCILLHKFLIRKLTAVDWSLYDIVGFSTLESQFLTNLFIARYLKNHYGNKLTIVFGGAFFQPYNTDPILNNFNEIDHVVVGKAENGFIDFLNKFKRKTRLPRRVGTFTEADSIRSKSTAVLSAKKLNKFPPPDYEDIKASKIRNYSLCTYIGDGCSHSRCSFCPITTTGQNLRKPETIFKEIRFLIEKHGMRTIYFGDWEINGCLKTIDHLCDLLIRNHISIDSWAEINPRNVSPALLTKMKDAGIDNVQIGIESFSEKTLKAMAKRATIIDNIKVIKWGIEAGMYSLLFNIICNHPFEGEENAHDNYRILQLIPHLLKTPVNLRINEIELYRTSRLYREADKFGISGIRDFEYYRRLFPPHMLKVPIPMFNLAFCHIDINPFWRRIIDYIDKAKRKPVTLSVQKLKDSLLISDSRTRQMKRYKLYGLDAAILSLSMDNIENIDNLQRALDVSREDIILSVNRLEKRRLIINENDRILSLPLKLKSTPW